MNKENSNDLISREALKEAIIEHRYDYVEDNFFWTKLFDIIDNAEAVDIRDQIAGAYNEGYMCGNKEAEKGRPQEWIPVSERLPENRDWYLGVFKEPDTDFIGIPYICDYVGEVTKGTTNEGWILRHCTDVDTVPDYFRNLICVAWQPLPEPYQKGGTE